MKIAPTEIKLRNMMQIETVNNDPSPKLHHNSNERARITSRPSERVYLYEATETAPTEAKLRTF